jgi:hypothetical protein
MTPSDKVYPGWIEHFSNKYIVCGRLVENDEYEAMQKTS